MLNYLDYSYSKPKGQTKAGDVFASSINMGKSDPNYTSDYVDGEFVLDAGNGRLAWTPVNISTIFEIVEGDKEATVTFGAPNASGVCVGTIVPTTTTSVGVTQFDLNPVTGEYTIAGGTTNTTVVKYSYLNENVRSDGTYFDNDGNAIGAEAGWTNVPEIELKINSVPIEAKARTLRSFWSFDASYELQKEYGQDIETLLATQSTGEIAHEIDNELTLDLVKFANAGAPLVWSRTITPGIALVDHYDSFMVTLNEGSNRIFDATRKVKANFLIVGIDVATVIESMRNFTPSGVTAVGPHLLGTLGNYKVFVNPDYVANEFVLGYKGSTMFDK